MPNKTKSNSPSQRIHHLLFILFSYAIFASILGFAYRYAINPDGISLLRLAGYIAEGNFQYSVTSGWSPLITWLIAPFLFFGFDGLTAARIAIALSGAGCVTISWFLALRFDLSQESRFITVLITALLASVWTVYTINPDLLFAALILGYIYLVTDTDVLNNIRISFLCGMTGGLSYLAHHYAFPFFLAHFPAMLFLKGYIDRDKAGFSIKKVLISYGIGIIGFSIITSLWISAVSVKYGHLTISSAGSIAHTSVGPADIDRHHPFFVGGLYKPRDAYAIHVFEDPSDVKFKTWSPFESREYFIHQLKVIKDNLGYILNHFVNQSPFFTYAFVIGILVFIPFAFLLNLMTDKKEFLYLWIMITFSIFCSGFALTLARSPRRFYALMIIFLLSSFHFFEEIKIGISNVITERKKKLLTSYFLIILVLAFALKPGVQFLKSINYIITHKQVNPYKEIAEQINTVQFPSPYAIIRSSQKPHTDYYIAYFLGKQMLGRPLSSDVDGITKELKAVNANSVIVFDNLEIAERFKSDNRYVHIASIKLKDNKRYEDAVNINIRNHEIVTGWDNEVNIFSFR